MKTKILVVIMAISLFGCDEDFLDIASETELNSNSFYQSQEDFEQAINGAYEPLRELYDETNLAMGENRSDNVYYDYNEDNRGELAHEAISDFLVQSSNEYVASKYNHNYTIVARVNQILATIDEVEFDDAAVKDNVKGQALFLRAFSYFDLVQHYGSVPLHLTPVTNLEETALPLSTVDALYQQIISDAQEAAGLLPEKSDQEAGRATAGAAKTLLGNVYIVRENWSQAVSVLQEVVSSGEYSLLTDYSVVFNQNNKNNSESVFEIQYLEDPNFFSRIVYLLMPAKMDTDDVATITGTFNAQSRNSMGMLPTQDLVSAYEPGDERLDVTIGYAESAGDGTVPYGKKYNQLHAQHGRTGVNFPVYRYSEVLLLLAEALNESSSGDPMPHLNAVRNRAELANSTASGQSAIRAAILAERRVELALENKRWLDLVRTGNAESVMTAFGTTVKANPQAYYFPAGINPPASAFSNIETLYPLPAREQELSPYF